MEGTAASANGPGLPKMTLPVQEDTQVRTCPRQRRPVALIPRNCAIQVHSMCPGSPFVLMYNQVSMDLPNCGKGEQSMRVKQSLFRFLSNGHCNHMAKEALRRPLFWPAIQLLPAHCLHVPRTTLLWVPSTCMVLESCCLHQA